MIIRNVKAPLFIAHRGYKEKFPENTLSAFDAAVKNGARMIELDVSLTRDRKIVVIHDDTLERTTTGSGLVADHTLSELKALDAGSWFSPEFENETIPTIEEVFEKFSQKTMINIEIKPEAFEDGNPDDAIEKQIIQLIQQFSCVDSVLISSFEKRLLQRISRMPVKPELAFLTETPADLQTVEFIKQNNIFSWNADYTILTKDQINLMHKNTINVYAFTVNDVDSAGALVGMGINGIFTDNISLMMKRYG